MNNKKETTINLILALSLQLAEVHIEDKDVLGRISNKLYYLIKDNYPEIDKLSYQEYFCEKCELHGCVFYKDNAGVIEVIHLIEDDHIKLSPKCDNYTVDIRIL